MDFAVRSVAGNETLDPTLKTKNFSDNIGRSVDVCKHLRFPPRICALKIPDKVIPLIKGVEVRPLHQAGGLSKPLVV